MTIPDPWADRVIATWRFGDLAPEAQRALLGPDTARPDLAAEAAAEADDFFGCEPGTAARLLGPELSSDPEIAYEQAADILDNWDSIDAAEYQARVEAGLEPEAEAEL